MKIYALEQGSGTVRRLLKGTQGPSPWSRVFTAEVTYPEAVAAIERKHRMGDIGRDDANRHIQRIERDFTGSSRRYAVVSVDRPVTKTAAVLAARHGLRGYDSVHLAAASELQSTIPRQGDYRFACADSDLNEAASEEGLALLEIS